MTLCLASLAAGLLAYIYFFELRQPESGEGSGRAAKLILSFEPAKITAVEVARSNKVVRAELNKDEWQLTSPPYPAQSTGIEALLNALASLSARDEITAQEIISRAGGLSPFGLDPPWATISLQAATNQVQIRVGSKTFLQDRVYVQPAGAPGIFMADASFLQYLPHSANQWRYPLLIDARNLLFDRIGITTGARSFKLEHDGTNQTWRLIEPMQTRADFGRVQYLLQQLANARVNQFVTDDPREEVERFGLLTPEAEVTLALGTNPVYQVQFGKSPSNDLTQVYARILSHTNVVLVARELADLVEQHYTEFRDRTLISFRPAIVDTIEVHADEFFAVQRHGTNDWRLVKPFQALADRELMELFLNALAKLEIVSYEKDAVADFAPYGLATPKRQYILKKAATDGGQTNVTLVQAEFGSSPTNEVGAAELDKVFGRRTDENSVYVVRAGDVLALPGAAFMLRDRHLWHFDSSNVVSVTILQRGERRLLARDRTTRSWVKDPIANAPIEETLHRLGELQADVWWRKGEEYAKFYGTSPSKYQLEIEVKEGGTTQQFKLAFGKLASSGQPYASVTLEQGEPVIFKFPVQVYEWVAKYLSIPSTDSNL
jgi:hypothetical protein